MLLLLYCRPLLLPSRHFLPSVFLSPTHAQTELTALQPVLIAKTEESAVLLSQVAAEQADAAAVRARVETEVRVCLFNCITILSPYASRLRAIYSSGIKACYWMSLYYNYLFSTLTRHTPLLPRVLHHHSRHALTHTLSAVQEAVVKRQAMAVAEVQADAQRDLDVAMPAFERAVSALDALDKKVLVRARVYVCVWVPRPPLSS